MSQKILLRLPSFVEISSHLPHISFYMHWGKF